MGGHRRRGVHGPSRQREPPGARCLDARGRPGRGGVQPGRLRRDGLRRRWAPGRPRPLPADGDRELRPPAVHQQRDHVAGGLGRPGLRRLGALRVRRRPAGPGVLVLPRRRRRRAVGRRDRAGRGPLGGRRRHRPVPDPARPRLGREQRDAGARRPGGPALDQHPGHRRRRRRRAVGGDGAAGGGRVRLRQPVRGRPVGLVPDRRRRARHRPGDRLCRPRSPRTARSSRARPATA